MNLRPNPLPDAGRGNEENQIVVTKSREGRSGAYASAPFSFPFWPLWLPEAGGSGSAGFGRHGKGGASSLRWDLFRFLFCSLQVLKDSAWGVTGRGFYTGRFWPTLLGPPGRPAFLSRGERFEALRLCAGPTAFARVVVPSGCLWTDRITSCYAFGPWREPVCTPAPSPRLIPRSTNEGWRFGGCPHHVPL